MALNVFGIAVKEGDTIKSENFPTPPDGYVLATMEVVAATLLPGAIMQSNGTIKKDENNNVAYGMTNIRGIKLIVEVPSMTAGISSNVAILHQVGQQIVFNPTYKYICTQGSGTIGFGMEAVL